jgi:hypothetical protein
MPTFSEVIYRRRNLGVNSITLIVGKRGIGKSYMGLYLCKFFDSNFTVKQVVFSVEDFLDIMKILSKRACVLFDESGIAVSNRTFMSYINLVCSYVAESFRFKGVDLFLTVPNMNLVDVNLRNLSDFMIRVTRRGYGRVYQISSDVFKSGIKTPILCNLQTKKPEDQLCAEYEEKRATYLSSAYDRWLTSLKENQVKLEPRKAIFEKASEVVDRLRTEGTPKKRQAYALANELGISLSKSYQLIARMPAD